MEKALREALQQFEDSQAQGGGGDGGGEGGGNTLPHNAGGDGHVGGAGNDGASSMEQVRKLGEELGTARMAAQAAQVRAEEAQQAAADAQLQVQSLRYFIRCHRRHRI
jgi:hypothetical protein